MRMASVIISQLYLIVLALLICLLVPSLGQNLLSCKTASSDASGYRCGLNGSVQDQCRTFAILRTNLFFSSLSNLSFLLGLNRSAVAEANGFSADTEFLPADQLVLIPIDCKCNRGFFQAAVNRTTIKGESFYSIAESLEGLTTCRAIQEQNSGISPGEKVRLLVPLRCACPLVSSTSKLLLSYPVSQGDTVSNLAFKFNSTPQAILSANNKSSESFVPLTSLLIPVNSKPAFSSFANQPTWRFPARSIPVINPHKKKSKMWRIGIYIAVSGAAVGASIAIAAAFLLIQMKKRKQNLIKEGDTEVQHLSLSVRTTSEKKVSFEGSQDPLDGHIAETTTPRKALVETYTMEELRKATDDFNSSNHIDGSVYHGRLNGKNLAVKRIQKETISKIDFGFLQDARHHHPNIIRLLGTCPGENSDAFLVFEFAKNGSLKDWLHGGLAMKNHFIASCYCFLTWNQRLKICLDIAVALQYMHQIMNPSYIHRNVKSRNIFLDEEFNAKIADFGMASCSEDDTKDPEFYSATPTSCSLGYLAPEYIHQDTVSPSMDIFAFGVVLLEVLSGQTPITRPEKKGEGTIWLSEKIKTVLLSENADELKEWMDTALGEIYSFDAAVALANLARACVEEDPSMRPNAGEIVEKLSALVEESTEKEGMLLICESSSKPLVKAAVKSL